MKTILLVLGTRPEATKLAPVYHALKEAGSFRPLVCCTGQHKALAREVLDLLQVPVELDLDLPSPSPQELISGILAALPPVLDALSPDAVLVQGDTASAYGAAVAAFHAGIPLGHVEAGLRTGDRSNPFPEEFYRESIALMARWHFAPTRTAADNLRKEGHTGIYLTGNTGIDALGLTLREAFSHPVLDWAAGKKLVLLTAHRRESWGQPLANAFHSIRRWVEQQPEVYLLFPVHPNPVLQKLARAELGGHERIWLRGPLDAVTFQNLLWRAYLVLTDSGGVQEEAAALGVPALVLREKTERTEAIQAGAAVLCGLEEEALFQQLTRMFQAEFPRCGQDLFGDGQAAKRIARILEAL